MNRPSAVYSRSRKFCARQRATLRRSLPVYHKPTGTSLDIYSKQATASDRPDRCVSRLRLCGRKNEIRLGRVHTVSMAARSICVGAAYKATTFALVSDVNLGTDLARVPEHELRTRAVDQCSFRRAQPVASSCTSGSLRNASRTAGMYRSSPSTDSIVHAPLSVGRAFRAFQLGF